MIDRIKALIAELEPQAAKHAQVLQAQQLLQGAVIELEQHRAAHPEPLLGKAHAPGKASRSAPEG
jgi:hypothetical protein